MYTIFVKKHKYQIVDKQLNSGFSYHDIIKNDLLFYKFNDYLILMSSKKNLKKKKQIRQLKMKQNQNYYWSGVCGKTLSLPTFSKLLSILSKK